MTWREAVRRTLGAFRRDDERPAEELAFHREMLEQKHRERGLDPAAARRAAALELGGETQTIEAWRDQRGLPFLDTLAQDVRYGLRTLARSPGFTAAAVVTLAIGIGANTAIFSVVDAVLLRPLPYANADRLMMVGERGGPGASPSTAGNVGYATWVDWRARNHVFDEMALIRPWAPVLAGDGEAELVPGLRVSAKYFDLLGVRPALGRTFTADDDRPQQRRVLVLSDSLWRRRFGADPRAVGRTLTIAGQAFRIVGVLAPTYEPLLSSRYYTRAEIWAPLGYDTSLSYACRSCQHLKAIARLRPGVSIERAEAEMTAIHQQLRREHPDDYAPGEIAAVPLRRALAGAVAPGLWVLAGAVAFVLLIACANVANLLLARALPRQREMAVRAALGAGRRRLVRQLLTESALLALAGAALGAMAAFAGTAALVKLAPVGLPRLDRVGIDGRVLAFTALLAVVTGLLFGILPALRGASAHLQEILASSSRAGGAGGSNRARAALIIVDLTLALVLLSASGLMIRTVGSVLRVDPGFTPDRVLTLQVSLIGSAYADDAAVLAFQNRLLERVHALPGVVSAAIAGQVPLGGNGDQWGFHVLGRMKPSTSDDPSLERYAITPDYFRTMEIPVLSGRGFTSSDTASSEPVIIVSRSAAAQIWPGENPIGARVRIGSPTDGPWRTVIGVAGDVHHQDLTAPPSLQMYTPQPQNTDPYLVVVLKAAQDPAALAAPVRAAIHDMDRSVPVYRVIPMTALVDDAVAGRRFVRNLLTGFAVAALLLAAVGLYGVVSYAVSQRTRELGLRLALGASASQIRQLILGRGAMLIATGLIVGTAASLFALRFLSTLVFGVEVTDLRTFAGAVAVLTAVALAAHWLPIRRAIRIDPATTLRAD